MSLSLHRFFLRVTVSQRGEVFDHKRIQSEFYNFIARLKNVLHKKQRNDDEREKYICRHAHDEQAAFLRILFSFLSDV